MKADTALEHMCVAQRLFELFEFHLNTPTVTACSASAPAVY